MSDNLIEVLAEVHNLRGDLTPEGLVEEATPVDHPLHHRFEWDNEVAGHQYRLSQARQLLRVTFTTQQGRSVRAFMPVKRTDGRPTSYEPIEAVVNDDFQRTLMLRTMEREWMTFRRRYEDMAEFAEMVRRDLDAG